MKTMMAVFAFSFAAALFVGGSTAARAPLEEPSVTSCPPTTYDCCDGTIGTLAFCADHGGSCHTIETICGKPV